MSKVIIAIVALLVHTLLIFSTNVQIYPELYFLPWLVQKGLVPYRDFFDHHGFLLYYFLAPLTQDTSFFLLQVCTYAVESVNLLLMLLILARTATRIGYQVGAFLAVLVGFFMAENHLWYDLVITFFYLAAYFLLIQTSYKQSTRVIGFLIALASMIKPNAAFLLLPLVLYVRDVRLIVSFTLSWGIVFVLLHGTGMLSIFINAVVGFNSHLATTYRPMVFAEPKFFLAAIVLTFLAVFFLMRYKRDGSSRLSLIFLSSSLIFFGTGITREHFVPIMSFFVLLVAQTVDAKPTRHHMVFLILLLLFCFQTMYEVVKHPTYLNAYRIPWYRDPRLLAMIDDVKKLQPTYGTVYAYTNHSEIYMILDQLPPTYFPCTFPRIERYIPQYEQRIIEDLERNTVGIIVRYLPDTTRKEYGGFSLMQQYIIANYRVEKETDDYLIYVRKSLSSGRMSDFVVLH